MEMSLFSIIKRWSSSSSHNRHQMRDFFTNENHGTKFKGILFHLYDWDSQSICNFKCSNYHLCWVKCEKTSLSNAHLYSLLIPAYSAVVVVAACYWFLCFQLRKNIRYRHTDKNIIIIIIIFIIWDLFIITMANPFVSAHTKKWSILTIFFLF